MLKICHYDRFRSNYEITAVYWFFLPIIVATTYLVIWYNQDFWFLYSSAAAIVQPR